MTYKQKTSFICYDKLWYVLNLTNGGHPQDKTIYFRNRNRDRDRKILYFLLFCVQKAEICLMAAYIKHDKKDNIYLTIHTTIIP